MSDEVDLARAWLSKAASDICAARLMVDGKGPYDTACFHSQQAAEKSLKALLALRGQPVPRTHDLEYLQKTCMALGPSPGLGEIDLSQVTDYGVLLRYDLDFWPEQDTALSALLLAQRVFDLIVAVLPASHRPVVPCDKRA